MRVSVDEFALILARAARQVRHRRDGDNRFIFLRGCHCRLQRRVAAVGPSDDCQPRRDQQYLCSDQIIGRRPDIADRRPPILERHSYAKELVSIPGRTAVIGLDDRVAAGRRGTGRASRNPIRRAHSGPPCGRIMAGSRSAPPYRGGKRHIGRDRVCRRRSERPLSSIGPSGTLCQAFSIFEQGEIAVSRLGSVEQVISTGVTARDDAWIRTLFPSREIGADGIDHRIVAQHLAKVRKSVGL